MDEFVSVITLEDIEEFTMSFEIPKRVDEMIVQVEEMSITKKRKSVEYNAYELVFALCLCMSSIETVDDIFNIQYDDIVNKLQGCTKDAYEEYMKDLKTRRSTHVKKYIASLRDKVNNIVSYEDVQTVFLEGKILTSPELIELNENVNNKQAKADVYVKTRENSSYIGFSIKQSSDCTKSNFSVEKIAKEFDTNVDLPEIRKKFLKNAGFETFKKEERQKVNALFYASNENNEYWTAVRKHIIDCNAEIKRKIVACLYPTDISYPLFEFDGEKMMNLKVEIENVIFEEHEPFYKKKQGNMRKAAKLFYKLSINNEEFRVEIRWKGTVHTASPQYQIHKPV